MVGTSILDPLSKELKRKILKTFWSVDVEDSEDYRLFFSYYEDTCRDLASARGLGFRRLAGKNHEDVITIVDIIWKSGESKTSVKRPDLRRIVGNREGFLKDDSAINASIHLALRLWTTINFCEDADPDDSTSTVEWNDVTKLNEFIESLFLSANEATSTRSTTIPRTQATVQKAGEKMDCEFSAYTLRSLHGIQTKVTTNIQNHLRYDDSKESGKVLWVFLSKAFLTSHLKSNTNIFPKAILAETITTLGVLFPSSSEREHEKTTAYLKKHHPAICDPSEDPFSWPGFDRPPISSFVYRRDRLDAIYEIYKSKPAHFWRRFRDFRDPQEWLTFWVGLVAILTMTFIFGCISAGTANASTVYTYQALIIAKEGLAIAQDASRSAAASASLASMSAAMSSTSARVAARTISKEF